VTRPLRVATRGSHLALRQVEIVGELLGIPVEPVVVKTLGDRMAAVPIRSIGGQGAFAGEVREALAWGSADIAVHSAKDLPPHPDIRLELVAFPERADPRDVLVGSALADIPLGGTVATGAPRRRAQLASLRPDLVFAELRGNIETRLAKASEYSAVVVAAAALQRLGIVPDQPAEVLDVTTLVPQVGQGVLAVEARREDRSTIRQVAEIDHVPTRLAVMAERAFLAELSGDCDLPAGAHATVNRHGVDLHAVLAGPEGTLWHSRASSQVPERAGRAGAHELRGRLAGAA
jgi:hydroxymethylbilane synthase